MKNKTIQKMLAAVLTATLTLSCFTACGNQPANKQESEVKESITSETSEKKETVVVPEEPKEPTEISFILYETGGAFDDLQAVEDALNEYIEAEIGVHVDIKQIAEVGGDLTLALAAGEDVDLFWVSQTKYGPELMTNDGAYDITDIVKEYPGIYNLLPEGVWNASQYLGRNYYIPVPKESAAGYGVLVPTSFVTKYGWDLSQVKEQKDLEPLLKDLKEDGVDYSFLAHTNTYTKWGIDDFAFIKDYAGVARDGDTTKIVSVYESEAYKEYVNLRYAWNQAGYIAQAEIERLASATINELRKAGEIGFSFWNNIPDSKDNATSRYGSMVGEVDVIALTQNYIDTNSAFGSAYMINSAADEETLEACMKFVNALYTDEKVATLLTYGIEGQHYELVDGRVKVKADTKYKTVGCWAITAYSAPTLLTTQKENNTELYQEFNDAALVSCTAGFSFDPTKVEAEIAACDAAVNEYRTLLEKGFYNPDEYIPKMVDALKKAGLEKVIAEIQTQYDAWLASK